MNAHKPKRYYLTYGDHDYVTDSVTGSDGCEHVVTMRGWHWHNLDWIVKNTTITEEWLVDLSYIGKFGIPNGKLSESLEATIYYAITEVHRIHTNNSAKEMTGEKGTLGSA